LTHSTAQKSISGRNGCRPATRDDTISPVCTEAGPADPAAVAFAAPRAAEGAAVDPVALEPVDALTITVLVDNSFDALLVDSPVATRARLATGAPQEAPQYVDGTTRAGLVAEHGFSALVTVTRDGHDHTLLFDTGVSPHGLATNGRSLGLDPGDIGAVVLSHGHADHTGGFPGLERWLGRVPSPLVLHPAAFTRRRLAPPGGEPFVMPLLDRAALTGDGIELVERREPSFLLGGSVLVTGEVDRTTEFERAWPSTRRSSTRPGARTRGSSTTRPSSSTSGAAGSWCSRGVGTRAR
jgi:7,8-dihydropterin-6-yl-methyl-4-(beta-D-ribofuranosyl)aminobenzene 5'-phosphate synthase